jgi:hypothetical protein
MGGGKINADKLEQRLEEVFQTIPDNALIGEIHTKEIIKRIVKMMDGYKHEIVELVKVDTNHPSRSLII